MTQRIHKVLLDSTRDHFALIESGGTKLNLNAAANAANPRWPPYTEVCIEAWELYPHRGIDGNHAFWVMRAQVRCCCSGACSYAVDHINHDAYAKIKAVVASPGTPTSTQHGPAQGYIEARIESPDLTALAAQARAVVGDSAARTALVKAMNDDAAKFGLSPAEIEGACPIVGIDANGLLSCVGGVVPVLAGTSTVANDYYVVAGVLKLWQKLVGAAHNRLALDWSQAGVAEPTRYGPRQQGGTQ